MGLGPSDLRRRRRPSAGGLSPGRLPPGFSLITGFRLLSL